MATGSQLMIRHLQGLTSCLPTHARIAFDCCKRNSSACTRLYRVCCVGKLASRMGYSVGASDRLMCSSLRSLSYGL